MPKYDVNASWDDPCDHPQDRRNSIRFDFRIKMSITVMQEGEPRSRLVGPGIARNLSLSGAWLVTKHDLQPRQRITLTIPTKRYPVAECLPAYFMGTAEVVRIEPREDGTIGAAIRFGESFTQNMDFTMFVQSLRAIQETLSVD